ncbi:hypothetical protein IMZ31_24270 (plasmid) [Pontibacillus sp. ALD_SL1]|uniref:hypothetical protein n=1 Tax=Pontibacillus sp. ALD_SL1 TaxID=2777185 RepID=UPI001A96E77D|nr:hypothetical protein [Pontibacillus sp. ALD_SL1]QST02569.1 hypothetical protein IMZ31_24270 [Pontibacillus sp. ALD_SL1]
MENEHVEDIIEKKIQSAADQARAEAKMHNTYVVYMDDDGFVVKEYPDGKIVRSAEE